MFAFFLSNSSPSDVFPFGEVISGGPPAVNNVADCFRPFAPCLMHTPPLTAILLHSSLLHSLCVTFAPCFMHTSNPVRANVVHPSTEHIFLYFLQSSFFFTLLP